MDIVMFISFVSFLVLLQVKHFIFDFPLQNEDMIKEKGTFLAPWGVVHSLNHGGWTAFIAMLFVGWAGIILGVIDLVIHYTVDYVKVRFGTKEMNKHFWVEFGLDQAVHQMTYVMLAVLMLILM